MYTLLFAAVTALLPGIKPLPKCPRPILVNIDLNHKIDLGVFKRTYMKCRRQYRKSPCLVKLMQPEKGAFQAICGEPRQGLQDGFPIPEGSFEAAGIDAPPTPNCSSEIFESYLTADWSTYQNFPVVPKVVINFCESLDIQPQ